jgi:hypothetical protein
MRSPPFRGEYEKWLSIGGVVCHRSKFSKYEIQNKKMVYDLEKIMSTIMYLGKIIWGT